MKKTLAVVLALVLTMAFSMSAMAEEPYKIAINLKTLSSEYWQNVKSGCDAAVTDGVEIEVQGALQVKKACPDALMIFVAPPGFDELQSRLTGRHTEDEETVQKRLAIARQELKQAYHYDYVVVNDTVSQAVDRLSLIVEANRLNIHNMKEFLDEVNHNA